MNTVEDFIENEAALLIFEHLTVEVHIWKVVRDQQQRIKTWMLIYANPPALRSWKRESLTSIKYKTTDEIFGDGASQHYLEIVNKIITQQGSHTFRDYFPHLNKHFRFTSVAAGDYFITTGDDITEFVEQQQSIEHTNQQLEKLIQQRTAQLKTTEEEVKTLKGIIPICSYCHQIRDDAGAWDQLEAYISKHSDAQFSHGICPNCIGTVREQAGLSPDCDD